jgi:O-antigen/teichoic acid export membrane protein
LAKTADKENIDKENNGETSSSFYRNIAILLVLNLLIKPIYILGIDAQVQNSLGESTYGLFFTFFSFCMLFQIILDPGILNYNNQLISKDIDNVSSHFGKIAGSKILLVLAFVSIVSLVGLVFGYTQTEYGVLLGVAFILILNSFLSYLRSHFSALGKYKYESLLSGLDKTLMIIIIGYFLYVRNEISLQIFIIGQILALVISCTVFILLLRRLFRMRLEFSISETVGLVKKTVPYALVLLLMTLYTRLDSIMLDQLIDDDKYSVGVYATGYRLLDAANMIGILFALLMLPMFSKLINEREKLLDLAEGITRLLFTLCTLITLLCWFYAKDIIDLIYVNTTPMHYEVFKYLMIGFWAMCMSNIHGCLFLAKGTLKSINLLFAIGILLNVALNFYWIPQDLAFGAVKATVITQFFVFLGQFLLAHKVFEFRFELIKGVQFAGVLAGLLGIIWCFDAYISLYWIIEVLLISFLAVGLSFLCGFLRLPFKLGKTT